MAKAATRTTRAPSRASGKKTDAPPASWLKGVVGAAVDAVLELIKPRDTQVDAELDGHANRLDALEEDVAHMKDPTFPDDLVNQVVREKASMWASRLR